MRKPHSSEPCRVPYCYRREGKVRGFCERCWRMMTDDERVALAFARAAPFWPRRSYDYRDDGDSFVMDGESATVQGDRRWAGLQLDGLSPGEWLHEFEARTTEHAICHALYDRRTRLPESTFAATS